MEGTGHKASKLGSGMVRSQGFLEKFARMEQERVGRLREQVLAVHFHIDPKDDKLVRELVERRRLCDLWCEVPADIALYGERHLETGMTYHSLVFLGLASNNRWLYTPDGRIIGKTKDKFDLTDI